MVHKSCQLSYSGKMIILDYFFCVDGSVCRMSGFCSQNSLHFNKKVCRSQVYLGLNFVELKKSKSLLNSELNHN